MIQEKAAQKTSYLRKNKYMLKKEVEKSHFSPLPFNVATDQQAYILIFF